MIFISSENEAFDQTQTVKPRIFFQIKIVLILFNSLFYAFLKYMRIKNEINNTTTKCLIKNNTLFVVIINCEEYQ